MGINSIWNSYENKEQSIQNKEAEALSRALKEISENPDLAEKSDVLKSIENKLESVLPSSLFEQLKNTLSWWKENPWEQKDSVNEIYEKIAPPKETEKAKETTQTQEAEIASEITNVAEVPNSSDVMDNPAQTSKKAPETESEVSSNTAQELIVQGVVDVLNHFNPSVQEASKKFVNMYVKIMPANQAEIFALQESKKIISENVRSFLTPEFVKKIAEEIIV